jgi:hypothetical protein
MIALVIVNATEPAANTTHALKRVASERRRSASLSVSSAINIGTPIVRRALTTEAADAWIVLRPCKIDTAVEIAHVVLRTRICVDEKDYRGSIPSVLSCALMRLLADSHYLLVGVVAFD